MFARKKAGASRKFGLKQGMFAKEKEGESKIWIKIKKNLKKNLSNRQFGGLIVTRRVLSSEALSAVYTIQHFKTHLP